MLKNNSEQLKIICTRDTKQREREREGRREGGRLVFTTVTSPKHITRAIHKYFTHTQNERLGAQPAQSQRGEWGREKMLKTFCSFTCLTFQHVHQQIHSKWTFSKINPMCSHTSHPICVTQSLVEENLTYRSSYKGAYVQVGITQNGSWCVCYNFVMMWMWCLASVLMG